MKSQLRTLDLGRGAADIHSPQTTVQEALSFSSHLRLGKDLGKTEVEGFIDQVRGISKRCKLFHFYLSRSDPCQGAGSRDQGSVDLHEPSMHFQLCLWPGSVRFCAFLASSCEPLVCPRATQP